MATQVVNLPFGTKNPYQNMLYSECGDEFRLKHLKKIDFSLFSEPAFQVQNKIVHIHWDDRLFRTSHEVETALTTHFDAAISHLSRFRVNGGRILWTIHNRVAHAGQVDALQFKKNRQTLTELADIIHVHTPHAGRHMMSEYGADPGKIRLIPHPSYLGIYEPEEKTLNRSTKNRQRTHFLLFGAMRKNRGLDQLLEAAKKLSRQSHDFRLSVVGKFFRATQRQARQLRNIPNASIVSERVRDEDIPSVFSDAHAFILPSTATFTSGTAMLAQTFGLPVIAPDIEPHRQTTPDACHDLLYSTENRRGLIRMMKHVMKMSDGELKKKRQACCDFSLERHPKQISQMLHETLGELRDE